MAAIAGVVALNHDQVLNETTKHQHMLAVQKLKPTNRPVSPPTHANDLHFCISHVPSDMPYEAQAFGQPWCDHGLCIVFDGRLHPSCALKLQQDLRLPAHCKALPLIAALWQRYGAAGLLRLEGSYRLVLFERATHTLILQRDLLSDRSLYFSVDRDLLHFSSNPRSLWTGQVNDEAIARTFGFDLSVREQSVYAGIEVVQAGQQLCFASGRRKDQWQAFFAPMEHCSDAEHIEHVRAALQLAVRDHLAESSSASLAMSLSGGVDSNLVYAVCNQELRAQGHAPMAAASWSLASIVESHELPYAAEHAQAWQATLISIKAENFAPLSGRRRASEDHFLASPYRELKDGLAQAVFEQGITRMFNGNFGDLLFLPREENLADAIAARDFIGLGKEMLVGLRAQLPWRDAAVRRLLRRSLGLGTADQTVPSELTIAARDYLPLTSTSVSQFQPALQTRQFLYQLNFSGFASLGASGEDEFAQAIGVEQVSPLRHRAVLRAMFGLPWRMHHPRGNSKAVFRALMPASVPTRIAHRAKSSSLQPFFDAAISGLAAPLVEHLLHSKDSDWPRFYQRAMIDAHLQNRQRRDAASAKIWLCLAYELWRMQVGLRASTDFNLRA